MKMEQIVYFEMSAYKINTPGNHPEENIQPDATIFQFIILTFKYSSTW
jgi:hypothetical protein